MANSVDTRSLVGITTPNVYVGKIVLKNNTVLASRNRGTKSTLNDIAGTECVLDLSMKEVLSTRNGAPSGWASDKRLYDKFRIKIIRSLDASITEALAEVPQNRILDAVGNPRIKDHLFVDEISIADKNISQLRERSRLSLGPKGESVREYIVPYSDASLPKTINHLTYFIVAYCDTKGDDLGSTYRVPPSLVGNVTVEGVVRDGAIVKTGALYVLKENPQIAWAGPVHVMPSGVIHTGLMHSDNAKELVSTAVGNTKIQDERALTALREFTFDISITDQDKFPTPKGIPKLLFNNPTLTTVVNRNTSFTDLYLNIDRDGAVRFFFGVDYNNLLVENTEFGKIYNNLSNFNFGSSTFASLLRVSEIRRMTLKRRRVSSNSEFNELCSQINGNDRFDDNELDEVLVSVTPPANATILGNGASGNIEEITVYTSASPNANAFRYFTGRDTGLTSKTYGSYQYALEIEIVDRSREIISNMISTLAHAKHLLGDFLERASSKRNYNSKVNRFNRPFLASELGPSAMWRQALNDYSAVLAAASLISNDSRFTTVTHTVRTLTSFVCSGAANPDSVRAVISLVNSLETKLISLNSKGVVDSDISTDNSGFNDRTSRAPDASLNSIIVENFFENQVNTDFSRGVGYDYLTSKNTINSSNGLSTIDLGGYLKRVQVETLKYFKDVNSNIDIVAKGKKYTSGDSLSSNDLRYLSPASVKIYEQTHNLSNGLEVTSGQARMAEQGALYHNLSSQLDAAASPAPGAPSCAPSLRENSIVESYGITEVPKTDVDAFKSFFVETSTRDESPILAPSTLEPSYGPGVLAQSLGPQRVSRALSGLLGSLMLGSADKPECVDKCSNQIDLYNSLIPCNEVFTVTDTQIPLTSLPNQVKSVILGNISNDVVNLNWFGTERPTEDADLGPIYRLGIEALCEVQVLVGFEGSSNNKSLAQSPTFAPLSYGITSAAPAGTNLFCRLVPYNNSDFNLSGIPNNLKLPIYNEYFIIQVTQSDTDANNEPLSPQRNVPLASTLSDEQGSPELVQYAYTTKRPIPYAAPSKKKRAPRRRSTKGQSNEQNTGATVRTSSNTRGSY